MIEEEDGDPFTGAYTAVGCTYALDIEGLDLGLSITDLYLILRV